MAPEYTIGDGIEIMENISKRVLDDTYSTALSGQARELRESSNTIYFAFGLALVLVFGMLMLVGLISKNGILIVEFANQKRDAGA